MHEVSTYGLTFIALGAIGFGIYLLVLGGDWAVSSSVWIAKKFGLTKLFIGATIIAFGTSAPELFTSVNANFKDYPGISLGNVIGSNIANILLILGISAIIYPVVFNKRAVRVDVGVMLFATLLLLLGMYVGIFQAWFGLLMFFLLIIYVIYQYRKSRTDSDENDDEDEVDIDSSSEAAAKLFLGFTALLLGSEILVQGAIAGGSALGVPEAIIGLTLIAFGTSLPELGACIAAARKKHTDLIIGGLIGSNIFNILSILGMTSMLKPLVVVDAFGSFEILVLVGATAAAAIILLSRERFGKAIGWIFVAIYLAFILKQFIY